MIEKRYLKVKQITMAGIGTPEIIFTMCILKFRANHLFIHSHTSHLTIIIDFESRLVP